MTFEQCATNGEYEECRLGDKDCCFVEYRQSVRGLQQLCTGCKDATACADNKAENFTGPKDTDEQCRPEMIQQKKGVRHENLQSVCRQCFAPCNSGEFNSAFCFGSINAKAGAEFMIPFATSPTLVTQDQTHGAHNMADTTGNFGIPTWVLVDGAHAGDQTAADAIATTATNVFFANNVNGKVEPTGDNAWTADDMTYWSLSAANAAWWASDLKSLQISKRSAQESLCTVGTGATVYSACTTIDLFATIGNSFS